MTTFLTRVFLLFVFWVALSGILDTFHLAVGFLTAVVIVLIATSQRKDSRPIKILSVFRVTLGAVVYALWLLWRIILAALHVSALILGPKSKLAPQIIRHKSILKDDVRKTIFANSITLTPGTITVDIDKDTYLVHEINRESSRDIRSRNMENAINRIFESKGADA